MENSDFRKDAAKFKAKQTDHTADNTVCKRTGYTGFQCNVK